LIRETALWEVEAGDRKVDSLNSIVVWSLPPAEGISI